MLMGVVCCYSCSDVVAKVAFQEFGINELIDDEV